MIHIINLFWKTITWIFHFYILLQDIVIYFFYMLYWFKLVSWGNFIVYKISTKGDYYEYSILGIMEKILGYKPKKPNEVETFWFTIKRLLYHQEMYDFY